MNTSDRLEQVTPESILAGYIFSATQLGAKFGDQPHPGYTMQTVKTALRDLAEHGFTVAGAPVDTGYMVQWESDGTWVDVFRKTLPLDTARSVAESVSRPTRIIERVSVDRVVT